MITEAIKNINEYGKRAKGRSELLRYLHGGRITRAEAIFAKCYECMGYYTDGIMDCGLTDCPLHPYSSYHEYKKEQGQ